MSLEAVEVQTSVKKNLTRFYAIDWQINKGIAMSRFFYYKVPFIGRALSLIVDRSMLIIFGIDLYGFSVDVQSLSIAHPVGVLLGGNGVYSDGRVVVMAGVRFGGVSPSDPEYIRLHKIQRVFELGDNVVLSTNVTLIGPLSICDDVIVGPLSMVSKSITEPGLYLGNPARRMSSQVTNEWVRHLPVPSRRLTQ
jgi:serine acetyltransferase